MEYNLQYVFTAEFKDGQVYHQNHSDLSSLDPQKSCYYDVLQLEKNGENPVVKFTLKAFDTELTIDFIWKQIKINRVLLSIPELNNYRIIYFRRVQWIAGGNAPQSISYHIGYQGNDANGQNVQQIFQID